MVQTLRIPTVLFRRTGIIRMKRSMHLEFLLLEISMVEIGYSPLVPTAFGRNILPNSFKKWWLRSPYTSLNAFAWVVASSGIVGSYSHGGVGYYSYGRNADRRTRSTAVHGTLPRLVLSTLATTIMSAIPTGEDRRARTSTTVRGS